MNASRIWTLGAIVAIVAIVAAAFGLGVEPQLASAAAAHTSTAQMQAQNGATEIELAGLSKLAAKQSQLDATDSTLGSAVTSSLRLSTFSRQVRSVAALDGVTLTGLTPGVALPYAPVAASGAATTSSTSSSTTAVAKPAATPGEFGKTSPLITPANFVLIPVTITATGDDSAAVQFASDLQHMNRLFAVETVQYASGTSDGTPPTITISGNIYALQR